jgi:23S rRNA (adenine-N6)-dimethyltransferase
VIEVGAGSGVLTDALADRAGAVLAVEIDTRLVPALTRRYRDRPHVVVIGADAFAIPLPASPFRVVANPPFNRTSALLRRLLGDLESGLVRADLIVQWQVARARARTDRGECDVLGAIWGPWWQFRRGRRLPAKLFRPQPAVDAAVLVIERRPVPMLAPTKVDDYTAFLQHEFCGGMQVIDWVERFHDKFG